MSGMGSVGGGRVVRDELGQIGQRVWLEKCQALTASSITSIFQVKQRLSTVSVD